MVHISVFNILTVTCVSCQWLDGDGAEDEDVAEEGDEAGAVRGDDHQAIPLSLTTPLFVQDFFFLFFSQRKCVVKLSACFYFCFFLILYIKMLLVKRTNLTLCIITALMT